jgi:MFS family permease
MEKSNLIQFLSSAAILASTIFIPVMAKELGASPLLLGLAVGIFYLAYFFTNYFFGILADRFCIRKMVQWGLILSAMLFYGQVFINSLPGLLIIRFLAGLAAGTFPAALAVYAFEEREGKMGRFTAYNSLGWAAGAVLAGLIGDYHKIFMMSSAFILVAFYVSLSLKDVCSTEQASLFPWKLIKKNFRIYLPYFFRAVGAQTTWAIFPLYLMGIGADKFWVGVAYFGNLSAQFIMMQHIERQDNLTLFNLGLLTSVITFIFYALLDNFWPVLAVQLLLAYAFSTLQVGAHQHLLSVNKEKAGAIGLLNSISNFNAFLGPFLAGIILTYTTYSGVMWFAAGITFIGLLSFTKVVK